MTQVVVVDKNNTVVLDTPATQTIVTGVMGPAGARSLDQLIDINLNDLKDGSLLAFNQQTNKWDSTVLLNKQTVDCGQF